VNGRHFERHRSMLELLVSEGALFGVGVSFASTFPDWDHPHMVIHMIAGIDDPRLLLEAERRKILLLGYKVWGRGQSLAERRGSRIEARIAEWYRLLPLIARRHHVSFDTLAIEQMNPSRMFLRQEDYDRRFMGSEGSFGLYVDAVTRTYALSSYSPERKAWTSILEMFLDVRSASDRAQVA